MRAESPCRPDEIARVPFERVLAALNSREGTTKTGGCKSPHRWHGLCFAVATMIGKSEPVTRPTVLVVDDESGPREAFRFVLEDQFNVLTVESGWAALDALRENPVDVITLDMMMPAISGIETLERIREIDSDVEVVIVTALPADRVARECMRLRAFDVLAKPFSRAEIVSAAERAAARRSARRHGDEPV